MIDRQSYITCKYTAQCRTLFAHIYWFFSCRCSLQFSRRMCRYLIPVTRALRQSSAHVCCSFDRRHSCERVDRPDGARRPDAHGQRPPTMSERLQCVCERLIIFRRIPRGRLSAWPMMCLRYVGWCGCRLRKGCGPPIILDIARIAVIVERTHTHDMHFDM